MKDNIVLSQRIICRLKNLKIPSHFKGFQYLLEAALLQMQDEKYRHNMMANLYPDIAKEHNTNPLNIERAIRHALGKSTSIKSNGEFLGDLSFYARYELNDGAPI